MTRILVPATSANLGPGFDSFGVAVSLYLELEILEPADEWHIAHELEGDIPTDVTNLIIQTALEIAPDLQPHKLKMTSEIPSARGLGSSSAAIVAGIELANHLDGLNMSADEKIQIASRIEGHPDNVMPAIVGDFVVGAIIEKHVYWKQISFPEAVMVTTIPNRELKTTESRSVLPNNLAFGDAVQASSIANILLASLQQGDLAMAGKLMEHDMFHEPYRSTLISEVEHIRKIGHEEKAFGTYLSGAGTTVLTVVAPEYAEAFVKRVKNELPDCLVQQTTVDKEGVRIVQGE
ncbi:homoserine kinase [Jeotgalibaca sp. A122]|uniref:homoserine kinase n=1 Tax=Jeotgalibaca sp. A122 TaxID=3457322 RepID=UPI003FD22433